MELVDKTDKLTQRKIDRQIEREENNLDKDGETVIKRMRKRYECERWRLTLVGEETHTTHSKKEKIDKQTERGKELEERSCIRERKQEREPETRDRDR